MRDQKKLQGKLKRIRHEIDDFERKLLGKAKNYETDYDLDAWSLMSDAMTIQRSAGELVQNIATAWRADLVAKEPKRGRS